MNNIFLAVKEAVTARQAAEAYGIPVTRNGMARCPFHEDHHPSMKIDERYYCFGCHETGDVIDFTAKLFGLSLYEAARKLAADFHVLPDPPAAARSKSQQLSKRKEQKAEKDRCISILVNYEALLKRWQGKYAPHGPNDSWHPRFAAALQELPGIADALNLLYTPDDGYHQAIIDGLIKCGAIARMEKTLEEYSHKQADCKDEFGLAA